MHPGHLYFLGYCHAQGERLVVGINSDDYIRRMKRTDPVPEAERVIALMELGFVASVEVFREDDPSEFIRRNTPDVHCIGVEYARKAVELVVCESMGVDVVYVPRVGKWSTTDLRGGYGKELP